MKATLGRRLAAEALGTTLLLAIVVGSGIMGERLALGNDAIALLGNSIATGCGLAVLITVLGPVSGAHFNPCVSLAAAGEGELPVRESILYAAVQCVAAIAGVVLAHGMFDMAPLAASAKVRTGAGQWLAEGVATFGLLFVILAHSRLGLAGTAYIVAAYITAAYWFTASTSFANPAVTLARSFTDSFAGIRRADVAPFVAAQLAGAAVAVGVVRCLVPRRSGAGS